MGAFEENPLAFFVLVAIVAGAAGWLSSTIRERLAQRPVRRHERG